MDKWEELMTRMLKLGLQEGDLIEKFILGTGKGGQKINKTSNCVYLKHLPTGIEIKCQKTRSQKLNRLYARRALCEEVEMGLLQEKSERQQKVEKIRRQKKKRSKRAQEKILSQKKSLSEKKQLRKPPSFD
ncbi:MAG: hypothetical protein ACD_17C00173G0003 [uncultured bacterium]|nr:MAG: hypothetical protein ACD_17C00173G0003 [uncultured bacterium]OGN56032.1 MAG: peptide chain release factor 1 [Chlamydiae bacterium RIFCSPHIGHO2_01_FULL_44_39]OGN56748.1 MAG: peptide chain release factor 1 [Chlamydiae bacterium RIFCSPHIGHO2_02_FULL_45_9]OGN60877.1 MAG: peptide chain release factor 1 [Chlamydiae bacterium RIFCSPHIGHO2_12_FULL_44_59]OGN66463.1 MAG: peptide chain release factor 1 [Chlamydiae bacterium RIFCSPLOWO2_01_FULL_44_52]OGN69926.1 MAG: peptide chain release factor 1 